MLPSIFRSLILRGILEFIILSILTILCGIIIILNPQSSAFALTTLFGILMMVYSFVGMVNLFIFKSNVNDLVKQLK